MEGTNMAMIENNDYQSTWDAETLAEAENIKSDPNRLASAKTAADKMAKEQQEKTKNLRKVARPQRNQQNSGSGPAGASGSQPPKTNRQSQRNGNGFNVFKRI